jgi:hypothetical protein
MFSQSEAQLSDNDILSIATAVVEESDATLMSFAERLEEKLPDYPDEVRYRVLAISLIHMLGSHLSHYARLTSVEETLAVATKHLENHITIRTSQSGYNPKYRD